MTTVTTKELIHHTDDGVALHSFLAMPENTQEPLAGVLVAPEWWGLSEHPKRVAKRLAEAGYVALAMDIYGEGKITTKASQANEWMTDMLDDPTKLMSRAATCYQQLSSLSEVRSDKLAAVGYCFGGKIVLDMARAGLDLKAVATFHGNPSPMKPAESGVFTAEVLFAHGAEDSMVPMEAVDGFKQEMDNAGVTYTVDIYEGAKHGFTNPVVDQRAEENGIDLAYDQVAAKQSWAKMLDFFSRTLA